MSTRLTACMGAAALALAFAASPASAQDNATPMHHSRASHAAARSTGSRGGDAGNAAIDALNAQSLAAAQAGQSFMPPGASGASGASPDNTGSNPAPAMRHGHNSM